MSPINYVIIIIVLSLAGVISIVSLIVFNGEGETNVIYITLILGFLAPTIGSIIAIMVKDIHLDVNSRMTELLKTTKQAEHAKGKLAGIEEEKENES